MTVLISVHKGGTKRYDGAEAVFRREATTRIRYFSPYLVGSDVTSQ
jgi:hypothetical protein